MTRTAGALVGLLEGRSDHDVVSVELLRRVLQLNEPPVEPVNLSERPADAARRYPGEVVRLGLGMAELNIPIQDGLPIDEAPVTTALAELDRLRALVGDEDAGEADWHGITRAAAIRQAEEARTTMLRWLTEHDARRDERDDARDEVKQLRDELELASRNDSRMRNALDQAEQDARTARTEIQRLGDQVDHAHRSNARLRDRIAALLAVEPTQAEYDAARTAIIDAWPHLDDVWAGQVAIIAVDAAWKLNSAPRAEDQPVTGVNKQADFMPDSMPAQLNRVVADFTESARQALQGYTDAMNAFHNRMVAAVAPSTSD